MDNKKNIVLIGMMGAGKSTIARLVSAKSKNFQYLDIIESVKEEYELQSYLNFL